MIMRLLPRTEKVDKNGIKTIVTYHFDKQKRTVKTRVGSRCSNSRSVVIGISSPKKSHVEKVPVIVKERHQERIPIIPSSMLVNLSRWKILTLYPDDVRLFSLFPALQHSNLMNINITG